MSKLRRSVLCVLLAAAAPWPAKALQCAGSNLNYTENGDTGASYPICGSLGRCEKPLVLSVAYSFDSPGCNPQSTTCSMTATVTMEFPGNHQNDPAPSGFTYSFAQVQLLGSGGGLVGQCGFAGQVIQEDLGTAVVTAGVTCSNPGASHYTLNLTSCPGFSCGKTTAVDLDFPLYAGCSAPPPPPARKDPCDSCLGCIPAGAPGGGAGCGSSVGGGGPACAPSQSGPGARLRYAAGGAGGPGFPGSSGANPWQTTLGRYWSHDYAQRIVRDPDNSHVWLIRPDGTFQEFSNLASTPGVYTTKSPTDEYRRLYLQSAGGGWELIGLDKVVHYFLPSGLWHKTTSSKDPTHATQGTYNASSQLVSVSFPDGRSETFTYHPTGKLASITEVGVGGSPTRTWSYFWIGDDLQIIQRPDGTNWEFRYDDPARPGYLTRVTLTAGGAGRVEAAFEYDAFGNVARSWRGDPLFTGPNAIDRRVFAYGNAALPLTATVTDALGNQTRYAVGRDSISPKPKVLAVEGACSTCGLPPSTRLEYNAAAHPLLPSGVVDGKGTRTAYAYNANGRVLTRTDASGTSLQRTTTWTWDPNNLASPISIQQPSTAGGSNVRRLSLNYHAFSGVLLHRTQLGVEWGGQFSFQTAYTYNASGEVVSINPPAWGVSGAPPDNADIVTFTYNLPGRNGHVPDSTSNFVGTTLFGYDGFNRRTSVTDPNGVQTTTAYDALNRVTEVRAKGATAVDDLVTSFTFNSFKDLVCVQRPTGNGVEYLYDAAGRLVEERRKANCNPVTQALERVVYQYDAMSNRTAADRQRWSGGAWVSDSRTEWAYSCRLDRVTEGAGSASPSMTEYCYDANENLEKVWDPNRPRATNPDPSVLYEYDSLNRPTRVTTNPGGALAASTSYTYDVQDHVKTITDAEGNTTTYTVSDRDVLTRQESPISGRTNYTHDGHGNMVSEGDGVTAPPFRSWRLYYDAVDRVSSIDFSPPNDALDASFVYDSGAFAKGHLTSVSRSGSTISYVYDRFGRVTTDGSLQYAYDKNGNRRQITYPTGVVAQYTHDLADRDATLSVQVGATLYPVVAAASYRAFGPLSTLTLGNGLVEQRSFAPSAFPARVEVPGRIDWQYTTDAAGNPVAIAGTMLGQTFSSTFSYQPVQHFLTAANGPWGSRSWTYDKSGNRLQEINGSSVTAYSYLLNATNGRTSRLQRVEPAPGGEPGSFLQLGYDISGILTSVFAAQGEDPSRGRTTTLTADFERHLSALSSSDGTALTTLSYDPRGFLRSSRLTFTGTNDFTQTDPTYSSDGSLLSRRFHKQYTRKGPGDGGGPASALVLETTDIFYFAGRPVAQLTRPLAGGADDLLYLTTDHLDTPILATDAAGVGVWAGGVEPFGNFLSAGTPPGGGGGEEGLIFNPTDLAAPSLASDRVFLRYPGQWDDPSWRSHGLIGGLYYNLHRWYHVGTGRYTQPDPLADLPVTELLHSPGGDRELFSPLYSYVGNNPLAYIDPLGLARYKGCTQDQRNQIGPALEDYCKRINTPEFSNCMCDTPSIPVDLKRRCANPHLVVRCKRNSTGACEGQCGWARQHGRSIRLCPAAWDPGSCGPLGCTLLHEMTHLIGFGPEDKPDDVEDCLGCP